MIEIKNLTKRFGPSVVLDGIDFSVDAGEILAVVGPSGAGKSTLAQCINLLERPTSGSVVVNGEELTRLRDRQLRTARRRIGTVFQASSVLQRRTAAENIALPLEYLGVTDAERKRRVGELLERVGLTERAGHYPFQLSGGQLQRVGIARALALRPSVLLSDEATSGLDPQTTQTVVALLRELRDDLNLAIVFITHEMETVLAIADSAARLEHGRITESGRLADLLLDHSSVLGSELRPDHVDAVPRGGDQVWSVTYDSPNVPADWLVRLAADLHAPVALLGASVRVVDGVTIGSASLGIPAEVGAAVPTLLQRYGLASESTSGTRELDVVA